MTLTRSEQDIEESTVTRSVSDIDKEWTVTRSDSDKEWTVTRSVSDIDKEWKVTRSGQRHRRVDSDKECQ